MPLPLLAKMHPPAEVSQTLVAFGLGFPLQTCT